MKNREVAAMSKLQNLTLWKEVTITHGKHFQMIMSKSAHHDPTQPKLSVYPWPGLLIWDGPSFGPSS